MTLATGTSGGCNFQHAAEQSSVKMIWAPARFECVDLQWVWSISRRKDEAEASKLHMISHLGIAGSCQSAEIN